MAVDLKAVVYKLLDKAGKDPRLTPRLLREKAEKTMSLAKGELKARRKEIKENILQWYHEEQLNTMKLLAKLAKVSGAAPAVFKGIKEMPTDAERINALRERLRGRGLEFSDVPTAAEIEQTRLACEKGKDLDGIDASLIIEGGGRKRCQPNPTSEVATKKPAPVAEKPSQKFDNLTDEEAEAEL